MCNLLVEFGLLGINVGVVLVVIVGVVLFDLVSMGQYFGCVFFGVGLVGIVVFFFGQVCEIGINLVCLVLVGVGLLVMFVLLIGIIVLNVLLEVFDCFCYWVVGLFFGSGFVLFGWLGLVIGVGLVVVFVFVVRFNVLVLGQEIGWVFGVDLCLIWLFVCLVVMLLVGVVIVLVGLIVFVGLVVLYFV